MYKLSIVLASPNKKHISMLTNAIACYYLNRRLKDDRFEVQKLNRSYLLADLLNNDRLESVETHGEFKKHIEDTYGLKVCSFDDAIYKICIDLFGLDEIQCYGSDRDKKSDTHILWDDIPTSLKKAFKNKHFNAVNKTGKMASTELFMILKDFIINKLDKNAIARGLYNQIDKSDTKLTILQNPSEPNEVTLGTSQYSKAIRILDNDKNEKDYSLKDFPLGEYDLVINEDQADLDFVQGKVKSKVLQWFNDYKI